VALVRGTHAQSRQSPDAGAATALLSEGTYPMLYDLLLPVTAPAVGIAALAVMYVVSKDSDRRARAWQLLKLLLRR
jgi:hypothetical protein